MNCKHAVSQVGGVLARERNPLSSMGFRGVPASYILAALAIDFENAWVQVGSETAGM